MAKKDARNLIVGLDVGTSKCVAVIGEVAQDGQVEVVGYGSHPSRGMNRGDVVNIELTVQSIRRAVENAEHMASCRAQGVYVGISGTHIKSFSSVGVAPVRGRAVGDKEARTVGEKDIETVIDSAKAFNVPADQKILHVIPQEFMVDGREGIHDPVGMFGVRLEARVHMVTGSVSAAQNIFKCVESCGLRVDKLILQHIASSYAVLLPDERELGICMVDIGGGTSDIAVFKGGSIRHTAVLPIAGNQVTNDISVAFRTPTQYAEDIKVKYGCALPQMAEAHEEIEVKSVGEGPSRRLSRQTLAEVIKPRYEELFRFIRKELHRSDWYDVIAGGIVLTGGSSRMPGVQELAEQVFEVPVRVGLPQNVRGLKDVQRDPGCATAVGLLLYARQQMGSGAERRTSSTAQLLDRVRSWLQGNF
jgi:cell division protein FtsA